jgi:clorobiocin biosynthesis protein CloN5
VKGGARSSSPVLTEVLRFLQRELLQDEPLELDADSRLLDLGLMNSVSAVMLQSFVERRFDVKVPREALTPVNLESPRAIAALVEQLRPRK